MFVRSHKMKEISVQIFTIASFAVRILHLFVAQSERFGMTLKTSLFFPQLNLVYAMHANQAKCEFH